MYPRPNNTNLQIYPGRRDIRPWREKFELEFYDKTPTTKAEQNRENTHSENFDMQHLAKNPDANNKSTQIYSWGKKHKEADATTTITRNEHKKMAK